MALIEKNKEEIEEKETKKTPLYRVYPDMYKQVNYSKKEVNVEVELPGVKKENISLKALPSWFKLSALRDDQIEYSASAGFGVEIIPEKTTAEYQNGLLKIHAYIRDPMEDAIEITF